MKILLFVIAALICACSYAGAKPESVATSLAITADNAKGSHLRGQASILIEMVKAKHFADADELAKQLRKAYEAEFDPQLKQYSFQSKAEYDEFRKVSSEKFEWIDWGYKECLQMQAFIKSEKQDFLGALEILRGIEKLAPVSAGTLTETGYILNQLGRFDEALSFYQKAHDLSSRYTTQRSFRASALRGMGFAFIELERLDEAEGALQESLELEPMSRIALNELKYIQGLRSSNQPTIIPKAEKVKH
jgi:tetratricopeptide (TPR) repeat protein